MVPSVGIQYSHLSRPRRPIDGAKGATTVVLSVALVAHFSQVTVGGGFKSNGPMVQVVLENTDVLVCLHASTRIPP